MNETDWTRIPLPIDAEADRRQLCAILTAAGLEVRVVRVKATANGTPKRYIEYRDTGQAKPRLEA